MRLDTGGGQHRKSPRVSGRARAVHRRWPVNPRRRARAGRLIFPTRERFATA